MITTKALSALALCTLSSAVAFAQEPPPAPLPAPARSAWAALGSPGQLAISVDLPLTSSAPQLSIIHESSSMNGGSETDIRIAPSADYFVIPNLSIGGIIGVETGTGTFANLSGDATTFVVGPRVGYVIPLADQVAVWPRLGIQYIHTSVDNGSYSHVPLILDVPVLWQPAAHFFLGAGLLFSTDLSSSISSGNVSLDVSKTTDVGLEAMIGGTFGGT
jgi:hypothetical protein